jgi:hypothetical protein
MRDPVTGKTGALLRNDGFDPLWMETNTSTEYWQKGASLLVTDPLGTRDVAHPRNAKGERRPPRALRAFPTGRWSRRPK